MGHDEFDALVRRLEPFAKRRPRAYFARVALLAWFGYLFWFLILGALLFAFGGIVALACYLPGGATFKIGLVLGAVDVWMFFAILRAIGVELEAPGGFEVHRSQSPALFALLDELSSDLRAPRFHHVLLSGEYNACVLQVPRLGVLGWQRNFLILGLPLLQGLTRSQVRAVLAHEFAHLSANHSRFRGWIYRVRRSWEQVLQRMLAEQHVGTLLFLKFFEWYAPYFKAYTFVLARANEYEADRCSVRLAGVETTAEALIQVQVQGRLVEETFWPQMMRLATQQETPEIGAFTKLGQQLGSGKSPAAARNLLRQALTMQTSNADTHPCLHDRLRAIGYVPALRPEELALPHPAGDEPATSLLGEALAAGVRALETSWERGAKPEWQWRYLQAEKDRRRRADLAEAEREHPLSVDERCECARIILEHEGENQARPLLQRLLQDAPDHLLANLLLGRLLLEEDNPSGVPMVELALVHDPQLTQAAYAALARFHRRHGETERLRELEQRYEAQRETLRFAHSERQALQVSDSFLAHGLGAFALQDLRQQLETHPEIIRAHFVRKKVAFFPRKPFYVLAVELSEAWGGASEVTGNDQALVRSLAQTLRLPGHTLVFTPKGNLQTVGKILRSQPWTFIYERLPVAPQRNLPPAREQAAY